MVLAVAVIAAHAAVRLGRILRGDQVIGHGNGRQKDKDRYRLRISARGMDRFLELVAPHVIPSMLYKLPL